MNKVELSAVTPPTLQGSHHLIRLESQFGVEFSHFGVELVNPGQAPILRHERRNKEQSIANYAEKNPTTLEGIEPGRPGQ